jgi:hypothetical protein
MGEDPTLALDQYVAGRRGRRCDQRNAARALFDLAAHPLDAGAGLARTAAGEVEPDRPVARGRELVGTCKEIPVIPEAFGLECRQRVDDAVGPLLSGLSASLM